MPSARGGSAPEGRESAKILFVVPGWPATRPRTNNGRVRIPQFRSRAAARVESGAFHKKDATGWLPSRPNFRNSLVQALRRPVAKLCELSGRSQRGDSAWCKTLDHLLSLLMENRI
jgi:hypothetical protein